VLKLVAEKQGSFVGRLLRRAVPGSTMIGIAGTGLAADALATIEERAAWARYGL
jgi:hypothetical protein